MSFSILDGTINQAGFDPLLGLYGWLGDLPPVAEPLLSLTKLNSTSIPVRNTLQHYDTWFLRP